jgi:hypothetical protein
MVTARGKPAGARTRSASTEDVPEPQPDEHQQAAYPADASEPRGPAVPTSQDGGATSLLARFLTLTPFLDLHERALKIGGRATDHRLRGTFCFFCDVIVRVVVVTLILGIAVGVAWKTLAPLPEVTLRR